MNEDIEMNSLLSKALDEYSSMMSREKKSKILTLVKNTRMISPIRRKDNGRIKKFSKAEKVDLIAIKNKKNHSYLPVFTDWKQVEKWKAKDVNFVFFDWRDYINFLEKNEKILGIVMNPFDQNVIFSVEEIKKNADVLESFRQGESVKVGIPEKYPEKMVNILKNFLVTQKNVNAVYLLLMIRDMNKDSSYLLVIDAEEENEAQYDLIAEKGFPHLNCGERLDFVSINSEFGKSVVKSYEPFYIKIKSEKC